MNRPGGDVALKSGRYLAEHRSTIGFSVEPYYRQENRLLERAKDVRHCDYIVAIHSSLSTRPGTRAAELWHSVSAARCRTLRIANFLGQTTFEDDTRRRISLKISEIAEQFSELRRLAGFSGRFPQLGHPRQLSTSETLHTYATPIVDARSNTSSLPSTYARTASTLSAAIIVLI